MIDPPLLDNHLFLFFLFSSSFIKHFLLLLLRHRFVCVLFAPGSIKRASINAPCAHVILFLFFRYYSFFFFQGGGFLNFSFFFSWNFCLGRRNKRDTNNKMFVSFFVWKSRVFFWERKKKYLVWLFSPSGFSRTSFSYPKWHVYNTNLDVYSTYICIIIDRLTKYKSTTIVCIIYDVTERYIEWGKDISCNSG